VTTTLWILSDLHVDRDAWTPPEVRPEHDAIVVAGDLGSYLSERQLPWLARTFGTERPVIFVPGNHDYWRTNLTREKAKARAVAAELGITVLLDGETTFVGDTRIVGATLWTDYRLNPAVDGEAASKGTMHDHRLIRHGPYHKWWTRDAASEHRRHRARIEEVLATEHDGPTVVVTHHPPHPVMLEHGEWREPLDAAYASDLSEILEGEHAPELWISGHTHQQRDVVVGRTRLVSNSRGYIIEKKMAGRGTSTPENPAFDDAFTLKVERHEHTVGLTCG
jgi:3',5'-cyclic AMP phosphodiesterase CpdA